MNTQTVRIMKMTCMLVTFTLVNIYSTAYAQRATLTGDRVPMDRLFSSIKEQTGYVFFYDMELLKSAKPVTVNVVEKELHDALEIIFNDQPLDFSIVNKTIVISEKPEHRLVKEKPVTDDANVPIKGRVVDARGEPLIGVSILVKGTGTGTTTDVEGYFSLDAPENSILVFSYIGFTSQEIEVGNRTDIEVVLTEDQQALDEVVITALGIERESASLPYSAQIIGGENLSQAKETNFINSLQGKIAGVTITKNATGPGSASKVLIRGSRSIFGNNQPLYVIDGVPMDNTSREQGTGGTHGGRDGGDGIGMLNSDDIETMTVLK